MNEFILNNLEIILCVGVCVLHLITGIISAIVQNKKIKKICEKCGSPVFEGEKHTCNLTFEELSALVAFLRDLKEGDFNGIANG